MAAAKHTLTAANEDYLEAVFRLEREDESSEGVRSVDVAELLGVSKASVSKAVTHLKEAAYVEQLPYGKIKLTKLGAKYAADVWMRHRILRSFLENDLGIDSATADREACLMEHELSPDTMRRWTDYLEKQGFSIEE